MSWVQVGFQMLSKEQSNYAFQVLSVILHGLKRSERTWSTMRRRVVSSSIQSQERSVKKKKNCETLFDHLKQIWRPGASERWRENLDAL